MSSKLLALRTARLYQRPYQRQRARRVRVEMLPLIDVMFLLVAFFMLVSISMVMQQGIFLNLAPADSGTRAAVALETVVVSITADGKFFVNKEPVELEDLTAKLSDLARGKTDLPTLINADGAATHKRVIAALDAARAAQLFNIVFAVEPPD